MFDFSPQAQAIILVIAVPLLTGIGIGLKTLFDRIFPSRADKASANKIRLEGEHISLAHGLQAFQVSDESLAEWIKTGTSATREMLKISIKFNEVELMIDDFINLMERIFRLVENCEIEGKENLFRQFNDLKAARSKLQERHDESKIFIKPGN